MASLQPLRHHLRQHAALLRAAPCLLISSASPPAVSTAVAGTKSPSSISPDEEQQRLQREQLKLQLEQTDPRVHAFVERNAQSLTLEFNLRTVPCAITSAFPTLQSVEEAVALAKRAGLKEGSFGSGDGTVIGIGSGAAMDLAKAVADTLFGDIVDSHPPFGDVAGRGGGSLVLAPCTLGGLWAASSTAPSLLLDTKEEMLLPHLTPAWNAGAPDGVARRRRGTVVALDPPRQLALPPLYTPFEPRRSGYPVTPSLAHVAAAALAIVLDAARSLDAASKTGESGEAHLRQCVTKVMETVASSCAAVLERAAKEARNGGGSINVEEATPNEELARTHLLDAIPRLSLLLEQSSILADTPLTTTGTVPQKLANALLPAYFPQCHLVTYLACILPGLCDVVSTTSSSNDGASVVGQVAKSIIHNGEESANASDPSLSLWALRVTADAGIPSMASVAYGTPDLTALVGSVESYETLIASTNRGLAAGSAQEERFIEDVLQSSLNR